MNLGRSWWVRGVQERHGSMSDYPREKHWAACQVPEVRVSVPATSPGGFCRAVEDVRDHGVQGGLSEKLLSQTLRTLTRNGLIVRTVTPTVPIQVTL